MYFYVGDWKTDILTHRHKKKFLFGLRHPIFLNKHDVSEASFASSSGKEAPNLVDPLDQVILSHSIEGIIRLGASLPEHRCKAGFRNVVFV